MSGFDRFMSKVDKSGENGCWLWTGGHDPTGYGRYNDSHRSKKYAHRVSFELHFRPLVNGEVVHHKCGVRNCVNPEHLEAVSHQSNVAESLLRRQFESRISRLEKQLAKLLEKSNA